MLYIPYPFDAYSGEVEIPVTKTDNKVRCDGCGQFMQLDDTYIVISSFKGHLKEECITKVCAKMKTERGEFELAAMGAKAYGKV